MEHKESIREAIRVGNAFRQMKATQGWTLVEQILKEWEDNATRDVIQYSGSNPRVLRVRQLRARTILELVKELNKYINNSIMNADSFAAESEVSYE